MLLAATPAPAGSRALTSDVVERVGGRCESRRRQGSGAAAWPRCDASRHSRRRGAARLRRRGSGAAGVAATPAPGCVTPLPAPARRGSGGARTQRRRGAELGGGVPAAAARRHVGGGGPAAAAQRARAVEAPRQWLRGGARRRRLGDSGSGAEARGVLARWLGRGAGRRRPGGSSSASSCAEPGEGGEVRHWPPLPLEQEDKMGREWMTGGPFITVADGGKKTVLLVCRGK